KAYEETAQEVLVESCENGNKLIGRTRTNRWISMKGSLELLGKVVRVKVLRSKPYSMEGEVLCQEVKRW
ncbi:MAG: TRAM domain-containing protein, partial [Aquificaceae bacterium]